MAAALFVTTAFLCAAAFVFVLEKYGPVEACLTGAAIFFLVTLIAAVSYMVHKNRVRARAEEAARKPQGKPQGRRGPRRRACWPIPMLLAAGLQVVRAIGVKRLIPILAVGGLALGFLMSRSAASDEAEAPAE